MSGRTQLHALLGRLGAEDLAAQVRAVRDVRELPAEMRGQILDVIGHEAAARGQDRDGTVNRLGRELDGSWPRCWSWTRPRS